MAATIGTQISGAGTGPKFLPAFWRDLGQALPGGGGRPCNRWLASGRGRR